MQRPIEENLYFDEIVGFLQTDPYATLLHECADAVGMPLNRCEPQFLRREIIKQYGDMLTFLRELPILLYFDEFLFVHGGYDEDFNLEDETDYLRFDFFSDIGKKQDRVTIVGHSPACNYRDTYLSNAPFFNLDKNIITIDGGCGIKPTGELNAFIVEKQLGEITYDWLQYNDFEEATVLQTFEFHEEDPIHLRWPETAFKIIEWGRVMTLCEHNKTGKRFRVFNNLLTIDKGEHIIKRDYANTFFNLPIGTKVELCQLFEDCALVKYDGVFGWLRREQICPHVIM
jgi:protein phosphatase